MLLFLTMVTFIALLVSIARHATGLEKTWYETENMINDPEKMAAFLEDLRRRERDEESNPFSTTTKNLGITYRRLDEHLEYMNLRAEFISPRDGKKQDQLDPDFDFADYLMCCLAEANSETVEVPLNTWVFMEGVCLFVYCIQLMVNNNVEIMFWLVVGALALNCIPLLGS